MKVLGLCASYRKVGNTEILIKEALESCSEEGAQTTFLRLTDLHIDPCKGCMACIFRDDPCAIDDDMNFLLETMEHHDFLILGSPTYLLSPPGIIKMILDRFFMAKQKFKGKKASTIGVAALPRWEPLLLPILNMLVLSFGYDLVESTIVYGAGPGEVLLDEKSMCSIRTLGKRLLSGQSPPLEEQGCPVCRSEFVSLTHMSCPVCGLGITLEDGNVTYHSPQSHRFTEEGWREHLETWILKTEGRYFSHLDAIKSKKKKYYRG
ncbi:MAG: flavodoxin family protein [Candidatus Thorarchaeota archaeon]|jgi:multimeric flavodoxin WrbA